MRYTPHDIERAPGLTRSALLRLLPPGWQPLAATAYDVTLGVGGRLTDVRTTDDRLSLQLAGLELGTDGWRVAAIAIVQAELGSLRTCPACGASPRCADPPALTPRPPAREWAPATRGARAGTA